MTRIRILTATGLAWAGTGVHALAQQMNPAPEIRETAPAGANSTATTMAATDFNWVWLSLLFGAVAMGLWYLARRRQSRTPPRR